MDTAPTTRASLLIRLQNPADGRAWTEFVEVYGPLVRRLARGRGLQHADVEDVAQEVFSVVAAAIERGEYDPARGSFRGWLFRIARNRAINALIALARQPRGSGDSAVLRVVADQAAGSAEESAQLVIEYRRRLLEWAADRVRGEFSQAVWQAFWATGVEGRPAAEVAKDLGMGVGSVYNAKSRVMSRLRSEIEQVEDGENPGVRGGP